MVYLPKDVDGLAIIEPESNKNPRIVAREKTPFFSKAKRPEGVGAGQERPKNNGMQVQVPQIFSQKKPFSSTADVNLDRIDYAFARGTAVDHAAKKEQPFSARKAKEVERSASKKVYRHDERSQRIGRMDRSLSERKLRLHSTRKEADHSHRRVQPKQTLESQAGLTSEQTFKKASIEGHFSDQNLGREHKQAEGITLNHPESISSHVRAIRDPDPENPDKKFTQLFMDDGFKKVFGTKLAVTPNKVFAVQDSASVKRGTP